MQREDCEWRCCYVHLGCVVGNAKHGVKLLEFVRLCLPWCSAILLYVLVSTVVMMCYDDILVYANLSVFLGFEGYYFMPWFLGKTVIAKLRR